MREREREREDRADSESDKLCVKESMVNVCCLV